MEEGTTQTGQAVNPEAPLTSGDKPTIPKKVKRDKKGRILPGSAALHPEGRPVGTSIKDRVRKWLDEHPDDMEEFVKHFAKGNRELAWQMMEGRPHQGVGMDLTIPESLIELIKHGATVEGGDSQVSGEDKK